MYSSNSSLHPFIICFLSSRVHSYLESSTVLEIPVHQALSDQVQSIVSKNIILPFVKHVLLDSLLNDGLYQEPGLKIFKKDAGSLFFSQNFSRDYEERLFSLKENGTRHGCRTHTRRKTDCRLSSCF